MYTYVHICAHTHTHTYIHTYIHRYIHTYITLHYIALHYITYRHTPSGIPDSPMLMLKLPSAW